MPILPLVDLVILFASVILGLGAVLKLYNVVWVASAAPLGFSPLDLLLIAVAMLVFALALVGRQWLKANEQAAAGQRASSTLDAYREARMTAGDGDPRTPHATPSVGASALPTRGAEAPAGWETRPLGR